MLTLRSTFKITGLLLGGLLLYKPALADQELLLKSCGECHKTPQGELTRIPEQRKTPEAWHMTIFRMRLLHGLKIDKETQQTLIRYLSDTQGMAPSETKDLRYALDRSPNAQETAFDGQMIEMCGRCHTAARVALQRRTLAEWDMHIDFHLGQYPTTEYQALGRDREWFKIAKETMVPLLAEQYPLQSEAWDKWQSMEKPQAQGDWVFTTTLAGKGGVAGRLNISGDTQPYKLSGEAITADGNSMPISGSVNIYSGYEWRASLQIGGEKYRQILAMSEDGSKLAGRQYLRESDSLNNSFTAARVSDATQIIGLQPAHIKAGSEQQLMLIGNINTELNSGDGLKITQQTPTAYGTLLTVEATADSNGPIDIKAGDSSASVVAYAQVDRLTVEPAYAVSRVGGGSTPAVKALFDAVGWMNGADGKPETDDDIRIGSLAADWTVENFDELAEELKDTEFTGEMDGKLGIFSPAMAGPNPQRPFSTNNAGNLAVIASHGELQGKAQMIVTVQRWNDPPIR